MRIRAASGLGVTLALLAVATAGQHGQAHFSDGASVDHALAVELQQAIEHESPAPTAIVVVDVESGKIIAARGMNLAAHRLETPGSSVKPFVLMTLLESARYTISAWEDLTPRRAAPSRGKQDCPAPARIDAAPVTVSGSDEDTKEITLTLINPACDN